MFAAAIDRPATERADFLAQACKDDPAMLARIGALLAAHENQKSLLCVTALQRELLAVEFPGDVIGRYKLRQKIGEGGCGVVWMAEQEEPVRRRVALKVIKLGMDTKAVVARFEAERQALAIMDHPNIAKVHDAGSTKAGRPYFVMELVHGIPITKYCDENHLTPKERLELFIKVCQAIQHAHQKGVIHRDIKPSNILVTLNDGAPTPKVIDFGIAKATQGRLTDATVFTAFAQFIGTPVYMSPEQAEMSSLDIDTRSDIYSLGVLLFELLTGRPPLDSKVFAAAGVDQIRQQIREIEPPKPSKRLGTLSNEERTTIARLRNTAPEQLSLLLRGDLDWIIMRCLEKDRTRRYDTANGLAMDIQRHLRDEPVVARPPSTTYLVQKLIRRHRVGFAASFGVGLALVGGLAFSTISYLREKTAHERAFAAELAERTGRQRAEAAEAAARSSEQLAIDARMNAEKLLSFAFTDLGEQLNELGQVPLVRQLTEQLVSYYRELNAALHTRETRAGHALAIAGIPTSGWLSVSRTAGFQLGEPAARKRFEEALRIMEELEASGPLTPFMRGAYAGVLWAMAGQVYREGRDNPGRDSVGAATCGRAEELLKPAVADPRWGAWADRFTTLLIMGKAHFLGHAGGGIEEYQRALTRAEEARGRDPSSRGPALQAAEIRVRLSAHFFRTGRRKEARELNAIARAELKAMLAREPFVIEARSALGRSALNVIQQASQTWDFAACRAALREAEAAFLEVVKSDPMSWGMTGYLAITWTGEAAVRASGPLGHGPLGHFHFDWLDGDFVAAESDLRKAVDLWSQPWATSDSRNAFLNARFAWARVCAATGRDAEADQQLMEAEGLRKRILHERPWVTASERENMWANDEIRHRLVEANRLNWMAVRASAENVLQLMQNSSAARHHLIQAAYEMGDYAIARRELERWAPATSLQPPTADIQQRFDRLGVLLLRVHVLARAGERDHARTELARGWAEIENVFAAGSDYLFNQVQTARALSIRAEIEGDAREKRQWLERAAGWLRPAEAAGRLTRYEREVLLMQVEKQLAALPQS